MIESAKYTAGGAIACVIDGQAVSVPDDLANRDRRKIAGWEEAGGAIAPYEEPPPERRLVPKSVIIARLHGAGKLAAASAALNADIYVRERWYAPDRPAVYADDPEALALLMAIGTDPDVILAP